MTRAPSGVITSPHNARVVAARKLRLHRERESAGAFLVEGPHAVGEALAATGFVVREIFVSTAAAGRDVELLRMAAAAGVPVVPVSDRVADALGDTVHPQGVFAVVERPTTTLGDVLRRTPRLLAVLVGAADPGNVGAVIRTADAAGADAVVLTQGSTDPYAGKCVRATAGSLFHLPVVSGVTAATATGDAAAAGLTIFAAVSDGEFLDDIGPELAAPSAWLFGNEAHGLPEEVAAAAHRRVAVPIYGRAESLNVASAAAVCLYAAATAQRQLHP